MNYNQSYNDWLKSNKLTKEEKKLLKQMNKDCIKQSFSNSLSFGTAGIRGIMGLGPNRLNIYTIRKVTVGYANFLLKHYNNNINKGIVIGYDNRLNSKEFGEECASILSSQGIKVYIFDNLRPTPEISFAIRELNAIGGIVITASHNPKEYNGYKVYDETGCQLTDYKTSLLATEIANINDIFSYNFIRSNNLITVLNNEFDNIYYKKIKKLSINTTNKKHFKIVYSPQHGTALNAVKEILTSLNYNLFLVEEQCTFDPYFSNTLSPNPEDKLAYIQAIKLANQKNANIILTTDPDGDRIGVAVKHNNRYHLLSGNETASLILDYILNSKKNIKNPLVISSIVTTSLIESICKKNNVTFKQTLTGFKYIGELINKLENTFNFVMGTEESYGCLLSNINRDKDAIGTALIISEMSCFYFNNNKTLIDRLNELYIEYGYYYNKTISHSLDQIKGKEKIEHIMNALRKGNLTSIANYKVIEIQDYLKGYKDFPKNNVIKILFEDNSFLAIRPSGTEPKYKIYYNIIAKTKKDALIKFKDISNEFNNLIN